MVQLKLYLVSTFVMAAYWGLPAAGVTLVYGVLRYPNFAIGEYMMIGAYLTLALSDGFGLAIWPAMALAVVLTGILAAAVDQAFFRPVRKAGILPPVLLSLGLMIFLENAVRYVWGNDIQQFRVPLVRPYLVGGLVIPRYAAAGVVVAVVALVGLHLLLTRTRYGNSIRAVANNPDLALLTGVEPESVYVGVLFMAGAMAAIGGIILGLISTLNPLMGWWLLIPIFAVAILGGLGNVLGTALGALLLAAASEYSLLFLPSSYKSGLAFVVLALVLAVRPTGLLRGEY